jgi:3-dehydroquinate synthase
MTRGASRRHFPIISITSIGCAARPSERDVTDDPAIAMSWPHRVRFTRDALSPDNPTLREVFRTADGPDRPRLLAVVDRGLLDRHPSLLNELETYFQTEVIREGEAPAGLGVGETSRLGGSLALPTSPVLPTYLGPITLPGGEAIKNDPARLEDLLAAMHRHDLDRQSFVLAVGGGALLDAVGYAASITHRGLRLIRMPTTTLAQADSGVGVKNGVNRFSQKNYLGNFAVPHAVTNDLDLLKSLSDRDWRCGLAEAVKVALLKDAGFFEMIRNSAPDLARRSSTLGDEVWQRSARLHLDHIVHGGDPFELTTARPLDFGHWAAHQLETLTDHRLRHGEAVAIGLALDVTYARRIGLLTPEVSQTICRTLGDLGFTLHDPALGDPGLLDGLEAFRQHLGGRLTVTLIRGVGEPIEVHEIEAAVMREAAAELLDPAPRAVH